MLKTLFNKILNKDKLMVNSKVHCNYITQSHVADFEFPSRIAIVFRF